MAGCLKVIFTLIIYMLVFIVVMGESLILLLIYKVVSLYFLEGEEKYFGRQGFKIGYQISDLRNHHLIVRKEIVYMM